MRFVRGLAGVLGPVLVALVVAGYPTVLRAQTTSASVSGSIQDSSGGVLPGVTVTMTSTTQGNALTAVTDAGGRFVFPIVRPDTYKLQATLAGFKTMERTNLVVNANDRLSTGALTMDIGTLSEEVSVSSPVTPLQSASGERSFTLQSETLKNIANNGRALFNFATLVPGALSQNTGNRELGDVAGFTVNGQRPNSNNITIDGVANIDTGNNGGNMATTNIDAVAEFKILTNAYQAEYGRAVGGQLQVVTKSGSQDFHGSGYWYGRRSAWDANTYLNKRETPEIPKATTSRNDSGYTIGGPVAFPGFNADKKKLFFFWSQEYQRRSNPANVRQTRVPTDLERRGDFSQSVDSSGNPFPYIRDYATGLPCSAADTRGCFQDGGVLGRVPASRLYAPGLAILKIFPTANFSGGSGLNFTSQVPDSAPRREDLLRMDFQPTDKWRVTGRYMKNKEDILQAYGTTWAGNGSDQLPTPTLFVHPGSNYLLSATGVLNSTTSLELSWGRAANSLNFQLQRPELFRNNAGVSALPLLFPEAVQADYVPWFVFRGPNNSGRTGNAGQYQTDRGPFTNENITHDVIANLTKVWGAHASKMGFYFQSSFKPQSIFASFNSQIDFVDNSSNPFDTGFGYANAATGVFNFYQQASKYALPEWRYKNFEWYAQDNWKPNGRLTLDYGVRFYQLTPQWDTTLQASNFLPDQFNASAAARLFTPVCVGGAPGAGCVRRGMDPTIIASGVAPTLANTVDERFIGRLTPGSNRFNGTFQAGNGINDQLQDGSAFRVSPRVGAVYDLTGQGRTIVRGGFGIFYDRPQGNMVFDMISNAPGVLNSRIDWGRLQELTSAGGDPLTTLSLNPTAFEFKPPRVSQWNIGVQHKLLEEVILDVAYVGSDSTDLLRQVQINALPFGATFQPQNQDPTRVPSATPGATALPTDLLRPYRGFGGIRMWDYSGYGDYKALQTAVTRRFDRGFMVSGFWVWSKAQGINNDDFAAGVPNLTPEETRRLDYGLVNYDRTHNFTVNAIYQTPRVTESRALALLANDWQFSGVYRWTSGRPYQVNFSIPGIGAANLTGTDGNPNARIALTCDPGRGWSGDPYQQFTNPSCFAPPQPGSKGDETPRFFARNPPLNNFDLSVSKNLGIAHGAKFEIRLDMFNVLDTVQFTLVNDTVNFRSLTDRTITNLPYDAQGNLTQRNGFGTIRETAPARTLQLVTRVTF
jgi:Carboxypeptidase regulatory-like domain/TonB dependent receptor/TonB-dependent Receptor Plug Domain